MKKNEDSPIYPVLLLEEFVDEEAGKVVASNKYAGLTKRELIAAMAMQGLLSNAQNSQWDMSTVSYKAVAHADDLLERLDTLKLKK